MLRFVTLIVALVGLLQPLPGLPILPEGTQIQVFREDLKFVLAAGEVKNKTLVLRAPNARMKEKELVKLWVVLPKPAKQEPLSYSGQTTGDGQDILLTDKVLLSQLLKEAYGLKLEIKEAK